jgi:hypothetical protein
MDGARYVLPPEDHTAAAPEKILELADEYANAALHLFEQKDKAVGHRPARLCALHATELYLHAFLRFRGATPSQIKARQHDLWHAEFVDRLGLDQKTCQHLKEISAARDYRRVRYPSTPEQPFSPRNRMERTLQAIREAREKIPFSV